MLRVATKMLIGCFAVILVVVVVLWNKPEFLEKVVVAEQSLFQADALVLMAGGGRYERLPAVVELYEDGVAPRILLTNDGVIGRWSEKHQRNLYHVEWAREYLLDREVPAEAIEILDFIESGSYFDALNTRHFVDEDNTIRSLLVVSSNYHTRRTLWTFERVFAGTDVKVGVYPIPRSPDDNRRWLIRNGMETIKLGFYWLRYGLLGSWT
jgi:uncharacterized SAM-binding protein YcdF (DUF218 family)